LLQGDVTTRVVLGVLLVKWFIWAVSLGSGTSGGVLAPLLMMGGALGGLEARFLPAEGVAFWPLISMGAILGGTMRSPFTSVVFAFELTHDANVFLPLLVGSVIAHAFTVLTLKRSILTEKVARRGYHLSREYSVDPLEILFVHEVMRTKVVVIPAASTLGEIALSLRTDHRQEQRLLPVVGTDGEFAGIATRGDITQRLERDGDAALGCPITDLMRPTTVEAYADEPLRVVVYRMAEKACTGMPVLDRATGKFLGLVALNDLLKARARHLEEERRRERHLKLKWFPLGRRAAPTGM
jgi:chloride channel protein, CIC family